MSHTKCGHDQGAAGAAGTIREQVASEQSCGKGATCTT